MIASEKIGRYEDLGTLPAELQAPTYRNMDKLYPVRVINRGSSVSPLPEGKPVQVTYRVGDETFGINEFMMRNNTAGSWPSRTAKSCWNAMQWGTTLKRNGFHFRSLNRSHPPSSVRR